MGLFGGKTKTTVGTTVSRVMEDNLVPNSIDRGILSAIFRDGDKVAYISEELIGSIGIKMNRYFKYGKNTYVNGVPSGEYLKSNSCKEAVETILSSLEGAPMTTTYCNYGPPNSSHIGWLKVIELYGLNTETNELTTLSAIKGLPVFMHDLQVVVPTSSVEALNPFVLEQWGIAPNTGVTPKRTIGSLSAGTFGKYSPAIYDDAATEDYFKLTYVWETVEIINGITKKTQFEESLTFLNNAFEDDANYFQARYLKNGKPNYFMYKDGVGTYPSLDVFFTTDNTTSGTFFPVSYFRFNKASISADKTSQEYLTNKRLIKYLGMDYDDIATNIDGNTDIAQVEQAMLMFGVPASTTNKYEQTYLFDFFKSIYNAVTISSPANTSLQFSSIETLLKGGKANSSDFDSASSVPLSSLVIQDKKFKMTLNHAGVYRNRVAGSIGVPGTHTSNVFTTVSNQILKNFTGLAMNKVVPATLHVYRRQITVDVYEEYQVADLKVTYHIFGEYAVTADETDDILLIPLDKSITDLYSLVDKEQLMCRAMHFVFNSRVVQDIKWYQTGVFKVFLVIVAIIITIISQGTAWQSIAAALSVGAITAAALIVIEMILWQVLFAYVFKLFVKLVGIKIAFILAIVAAVSGTYIAIDAGSIAGAPWAGRLLQVSTGLTSAGDKVIQDEMQDLLGEMSAFDKQMKEEMKLLDDAKKMLEGSVHLNPFIIFGESPDEFYNRTIHAGNIGIVGIDAISNFVESQLKLPDLITIDQFQGEYDV